MGRQARTGASFSLLLSLALAMPARAQAPTIAAHTDAPPAELAGAIKAALEAGGQRVVIGAKTLDFWWVKTLPPGSTAMSWDSVAEGTLAGVVKLSASYPDIRGKTVQAGVYTLRYGVQPQNGDHLGVSPYRDFLMLSTAAVDTAIAVAGHDAVVALSKQTPGVSHPPSWSLDPPVATEAPGSTRKSEGGQTAIIFAVPTSAGPLKFGLILVGTIQP